MAKSHMKKNWFKKLFRKRQKSEKSEENGSQARVLENNVQLAQEPANIPEEVHLEQVHSQNEENMQQIVELKKQLETSGARHNKSHPFKIKSILVEMKRKENRHEAMCLENKVHIDNIEKLNNDLLCLEEKLHQQKLQHNNNEEKLNKQIKSLLQRLNVKDKQCKQFTLKNKELSEELKKLTDKFSEVELQLQDQWQQHKLQKHKDVKNCQKVEVLSQRLSANDEHFNELTLRNNVLSEDLAKLGSRFSELEQEFQEQRQWQGPHNDNYCHQVTLLMADLKNKNDCLDAVVLKNDQIMQTMHQMCIKVQNLEQQNQEPQQNPCSRQNQEPQQNPCSQPLLEKEKPQKEQMDQNNLQYQPQQNKKLRIIHHVIECGEPIKSTSTAWRPTKKRGMTSDEDVIGQFRSLLNKLTPENFKRIVNKMKVINITRDDHLKDIVHLVLNKAMLESKFSEVYANMCYHLSKIEVQQTSKPGNILNFRILLIQGYKNEFKMGMDGSSSLDDEASKEKARRRAIGNVIFIGELFKAKVLHESVISDIVRGLLKDGKEQSFEYLCRLLGVAGEILDSTQPAMMNEHFTSLNRLVKGQKMSSRICFMLQDLIDLRMRKWIPRQKVERPMYLQEMRESL